MNDAHQSNDAPPEAEPSSAVVVSDEPLAVIPSMPISQLLGRTRANIETLFHPARPDTEPGWTRYNQHLIVRYEGEVALELVQLVPGGLDCVAAAHWMGFGDASPPLRRRDRCLWPPQSDRHSLGEGVSGELILQGGRFTARLDRSGGEE